MRNKSSATCRRAIYTVAFTASVLVGFAGTASTASPGERASGGVRRGVPADWAIVGNAADRDGFLELTPDAFNQAGAVWQREQVDLRGGFDRTFQLSLGDDDAGADGIVFALQQVGTEAIGSTGQGLGYGGISPSVGIELDTFQNGGEPPEDHLAVDENGSVGHNGAAAVVVDNLEDGLEHTLRIVWSPSTTELDVDLDGVRRLVYTKNLVDDIFGGNPLVYVGFTAATGGSRNAQYVRSATPLAELSWSAPSLGGTNPPGDLAVSVVSVRAGRAAGLGSDSAVPASPGAVTAYRVYRSSAPNVVPGPDTLFATVPPERTSILAPLGTDGSYFVVTAVYGTAESAPSNEIGAGFHGPALAKVKLKHGKIVAKGSGFTRAVRVFLDGLAFESPAIVKKGKRVTQSGALETGQQLAAYLTSGRSVTVTFVNDDGTLTSMAELVP